jgi:hypothetical protein
MSHILRQNSMRYSRMLEESSFANRKADYFWLLFLSSLMLLVRPSPSLLPINTDHSYPQLRACPRSSTSPFSPPRSPTCPSTSGPAGTPRRPYPFLACSPSPRHTFPLPSSPFPGCSLARGARRQATSSGVQWVT